MNSALATFAGSALLGSVTLGIEVLASRLTGGDDRKSGAHEHRTGVRVPSSSQEDVRAGLALMLGASRFWLAALGLLTLVLLLGRGWAGPRHRGFVVATLVDTGYRLRRLQQAEH